MKTEYFATIVIAICIFLLGVMVGVLISSYNCSKNRIFIQKYLITEDHQNTISM
jgi:ABC-type arginine transport system permease subunit